MSNATPVPRLVAINRQQLLLRSVDVEQLVDEDHCARAIWELVGRLDLRLYHAQIAAVEGSAGREHTDPAGGRALIPKSGLRVPHPCWFCLPTAGRQGWAFSFFPFSNFYFPFSGLTLVPFQFLFSNFDFPIQESR